MFRRLLIPFAIRFLIRFLGLYVVELLGSQISVSAVENDSSSDEDLGEVLADIVAGSFPSLIS